MDSKLSPNPNYQNTNNNPQIVQTNSYMPPPNDQQQYGANITSTINALNNSQANDSNQNLASSQVQMQIGGGYQPGNHHIPNHQNQNVQSYQQMQPQMQGMMMNQNMIMMKNGFQNHNQNHNQNYQSQQQQQVNNKFKTQRCWHFDNNGNCVMADKCHFAHGDAELRDPSQPIPFNMLNQAQRKVPSGPRTSQYKGHMQNDGENQNGSGQMNIGRGGYHKPYTRGGRDMNSQSHAHFSSQDGGNMNGGRGGYHNKPRFDYQNQHQQQPIFNNHIIQDVGDGDAAFNQQNNLQNSMNKLVRNPQSEQPQPQQVQSQFQFKPQQVKPVQQFVPGQVVNQAPTPFAQTPQFVQNNYQQRSENNKFQSDQQQQYNPRANQNYKTDFCKFYEAQRNCPYLNRCSFAHGKKELRPKPPMQEGVMPMSVGYNKFGNVSGTPGLQNGMIQSLPMPIVPMYGMPQQHHNQQYSTPDQHQQIQQPQYINGGFQNQNMIVDPSSMIIYPQQTQNNQYPMYLQQPQVVQVQKQIVIHQTDSVGQIHQRVLTIFVQPMFMHSAQVNNAIKQASDYCEQGKVREAEQILQGLCGDGQIAIRDETTTQNHGYSMQPQDNK